MYSNSAAQRLRERPFDRRSATAKTLDYRLFAQDVFMGWTRQMTDADGGRASSGEFGAHVSGKVVGGQDDIAGGRVVEHQRAEGVAGLARVQVEQLGDHV